MSPNLSNARRPGGGTPAPPAGPRRSAQNGGNSRRAEPGALGGAGTHLRRALRVDLAPGELLPDEQALTPAFPGGAEGSFGRLLLWRRSMLYLGFFVLLPSLLVDAISTIVEIADPDTGGLAIDRDSLGVRGGLRFVVVCLNIALAFGVYAAFRRWSDWARSRKVLFVTWTLAFVAPFLVALFPMRSLGGGNAQMAMFLGLVGALEQVLGLAPKVLALIPGLLRAAVSAKLLFPRATAPGWLVTLASPFYLLLLFVIMIMPYQLSGSPLLVLSMISFLLAPVWLWRSGMALARPSDHATALAVVKRTRGVGVALNGAGALFLFVGVVTSDMSLDALSVVRVLLSLAANIFILSVVAMDVLIGGMSRARATALADDGDATGEDPLDTFIAAADAVGGDERAR